LTFFLLYGGVIGLDVYWGEGGGTFLSQYCRNLSARHKKLTALCIIVLFIFTVGSSVINDQIYLIFSDIVVRIGPIFIYVFTRPSLLHGVIAQHGALQTHTV